ncbi:aldo/keto reductase [Pelagibacteraceae bacterium]|jgi:aryl-alcohol dehydrogenase-like predicted oxidoreductase|nr:aldo/keto reductase [Pelagibacteraceae bacterium]MDC3233164.1 aldo/keto reductase [Pelagibacteraceae bacterium]|tara:strand:+ start:66 stop:1103 length:1038 start_codon:yes stop_codon:yes gene_type:complete
MKFKKLGNTNLDVSVICLGTMTWGTQNSEKDAFEQMDYSVNNGVNFFDTAEIYSVPPDSESFGKTETMIGNWFEKRRNREKIILASKVAGPRLDWVRGGENNYNEKNIGKAIDGSLKRLKTDYIDLYQLHWPERSTNCFGRREFQVNKDEAEWNDFESVLKALEKFIKSGKIRYIGMSNETPYGLSKYLELSKNKDLPRMMSVQNPYSLVNRTYEIGMSEISIREKCGLLVYYPLAAGALSGKYRGGQMPKNSRMTLFKGWERMINPLAMKAYDEYYELAREYNMTMVQLAQAFVNSRPFVTSNIIGATTMEQLKENIGSIGRELTEEMMEKINLIHNNNPNPSP